jgi:uncharacterized repeat protein (TIGR03987 family)
MSIVSLSVLFIVTAFLLYTLAVWSERFAARLKVWHLAVFWLGFVADAAGTSLMMQIAQTRRAEHGLVFSVHSTTGMLALVLMFAHCAWASMVLYRKDEEAILSFHKFSTLVWGVWLVPFFIGAAMEGLR